MEAATALTRRQPRSGALPAARATRNAAAAPARTARPRPTARPAARPRPATQTRPRTSARRARTAPKPITALGDLADSRLILRLTRSQAWIAIIGALLIGIVALNVYSLGMGSTVSSAAERATELERQNSLLREEIGKLRKNGELERFAAKLGLGQPASEQITSIQARPGDAERAAKRLKGELAAVAAPVSEPVVAAEPEPVATETAPVAETADPAVADPAVTDPAAAGTVAPAPDPTATPVAPTDAGAATAGGIAP